MNDIYTKSQELIDDFFNTISDQEFLNDYLAVEQFKGPLIKDFLGEYSVSEVTYTIIGQTVDIKYFMKEKLNSNYIHLQEATLDIYDSSFAANDDNCIFGLAA